MDVAIRVDPTRRTATTVPMGEVKRGDAIVVGRKGIRVQPLTRPKERDVFSFMEAQVSAERPHGHIITDVAKRMIALRELHRSGQPGGKVLFAGGPAIIHSGGREALTWLIEEGFIHVLFCGNALAVHDIEADLYGTSLGYGLCAGRAVPHGHEHHLRAINRMRAVGSIETAVRTGVVKQGIMAACVRHGVHVAWGSRCSWRPLFMQSPRATSSRPRSRRCASMSTLRCRQSWPTGGAFKPWDS
jgi:hypothetical protein